MQRSTRAPHTRSVALDRPIRLVLFVSLRGGTAFQPARASLLTPCPGPHTTRLVCSLSTRAMPAPRLRKAVVAVAAMLIVAIVTTQRWARGSPGQARPARIGRAAGLNWFLRRVSCPMRQ